MARLYIALAMAGLMATSAQALFDGGVVTASALSLLNGEAWALALGGATASSTVFVPTATILLGLVSAGALKALYLAGAGDGALRIVGGRRKRSAADTLALIDDYFMIIAKMDVDDCGKRLVCEIETVDPTLRSSEESIIANLFGEDDAAVVDPTSPKAEFDLAAYLGQASRSKFACARRYNKCPINRTTLIQALGKLQRQ